MHSASPAVQHPLKRKESRRRKNECKIAPAASASWSAQDQPFGDRHGHTDTAPGPTQSSSQRSQILATQEKQWKISHRERATATHTQVWAPLFHPTGGSFSQQKYDIDKATNPTQDALRIDTIIHTTVQTHVGPLAEGCGRLAEFLAQTPWEEKKNRPGGYPARNRATPKFTQLHLPPFDADAGRPTN